MLNMIKKSIAVFLSFLITFVALNFTTNAVVHQNENLSISNDGLVSSTVEEEKGYSEYITANNISLYGGGEILLFDSSKDAFVNGEKFECEFNSQDSFLYQIKITYNSLEKRDTELSVLIDGKIPFYQAKDLKLRTHYCDDGQVRVDGNGNEFAPEQIISNSLIESTLRDYAGEFEDPYLFALNKGVHKINFVLNKKSADIKTISLVAAENVYEYNLSSDIKEQTKDVLEIEGEDAYLKSSASLIPLSDDNSCDVSPYSATKAVINYIGGSNWSSDNDTLYWQFNVKNSGYYSLGFLYRQNKVLGGISYRHLKIDGKTPFLEAEKIKFKYNTNWQYVDFKNDKENYLVYLEAGSHTLSLSVTAGEITEYYRRLKEVATKLGDLYIDITMVVGETVDVSRSYELFNQIPQFNERLKAAADELNEIADSLEVLQEKKGGSNVSTIRNAIETIEKMYNNPYSAHKYKSAYYSAYTNLSALLGTLTDMPLDIDRIFIISKDAEFENPCANLFKNLAFGFTRFIDSFAGDYSVETKEEEGLTIWVNWGRDQTQVLDSLIQSDFVKNEGIPVKVKLVNATLIQAILSGDGPDVMLQMSRTEPVNLAMRGALVDLSQFNDFEQVMGRFSNNARLPFSYGKGVYALPDTMSFYLMFVRNDIINELGLEIPKTWQEFIYAMTILQHNNLQVSLPYTQITDSTTVNIGVGGLTLYPTMLLQNGLSLYNEELTASTLTLENQIGVFSNWVQLYTKYKVPVTMDFYNRFRIGSAPMGIAPYTLYTQLKAAAPEIDGRWSVALIPGTVDEIGNVNHTSAGSGAGCAITKLSKNPDKAWQFLKWWTNAQTQLKYSESLESLLGPLGRVASANIEAINNMVWDDQMISVLNEQLENVAHIPEVPGGYYTARGIDQAFWNVVEQNQNPTDMMLEWGSIVDGEIRRKRLEFAE